ncbi:MAG: hypothetical protein FWC32_08560 [Firmicutes bacterium]|nr:hypothetical protein [Bacillota bacterium]
MSSPTTKLSKYDFCTSCRKARHSMSNGSQSNTLEEFLDSRGYQSPMGHIFGNTALGLYAKEGDVCAKCKLLLFSVAGYNF